MKLQALAATPAATAQLPARVAMPPEVAASPGGLLPTLVLAGAIGGGLWAAGLYALARLAF